MLERFKERRQDEGTRRDDFDDAGSIFRKYRKMFLLFAALVVLVIVLLVLQFLGVIGRAGFNIVLIPIAVIGIIAYLSARRR